ncbi:MAG: periplasmic chaperone for outer membrane proteins SurA, partial [Rhodobacteraceae bacterium HLUCCA24]
MGAGVMQRWTATRRYLAALAVTVLATGGIA